MLAASFPAVAAGAVLGVALVVAGVAKIGSGARWLAQAAAMGTPRSVARLVPWVEIVVGAAAAVRLATPWSQVAAAALLTAFSILIAVRLTAGEHPPCACFGTWSARPLSWRHLLRNAILIGLAIVAAVA